MQYLEKPIVEGQGYVCACCGLPHSGALRWNHETRVCEDCGRHQQGGEMQKHGEHKRKWAAWAADMMRRLQAEKAARASDQHAAKGVIEGLRTEAQDLRDALSAGIESMPPATIASYFETEAVRDALDERDNAFRLRDLSMQTLWRIDQRHNAESEKKKTCTCGNSTCDLPRLMADEVLSLRRWETNQETRAKDGKDHHLPDEHPTARKYPSRRGWGF